VLERALAEEMTGHLGYEKHDPARRGSGNSRNGSTRAARPGLVRPAAIDRDAGGDHGAGVGRAFRRPWSQVIDAYQASGQRHDRLLGQ
jgi:hypothetical protein